MYLLYSLLLTFGFVLLLPRFALDAFRTRKYVTGLGERLGQLPNFKFDGPTIWLHCVSVGETEAAKPLVRALNERFPNYRLVISTTTVAGQQLARNAFAKNAAAVFYFPIDWTWVARRVLRKFDPAAVLIIETELWPNFLRECRRRSIPVAIVNGRISQKSSQRYQMIRGFVQRMLNDVPLALMQSEQDAARILELGIPRDRVLVVGNLKFDSASMSGADESTAAGLRERFGFSGQQRVIVAASTHAPEEKVVIEAFKSIKASTPHQRIRLIIAPRHSDRFNEVAELLSSSNYNWARRSDPARDTDRNCDIVLLDSIGELRAAFALADVAFIGGSITPHGGHNVLEPAAQGVCVVTGPHTQNFTAIVNGLRDSDAIVQLPDVADDAHSVLASTISDLLMNDSRRIEIGKRAKAVCERNTGATQRAIEQIANLIDARESDVTLPLPSLHVSTAAK